MEGLTQNPAHFVAAEDTLKVRHLNRDGAAFAEAMQADPPVDYEGLKHGGSLFARAHRYFSEQVSAWVRAGSPHPEPDSDPANNAGSEAAPMAVSEQQVADRAAALAWVLTHGLQLVVIDLRREENSQAIFETLNARGTPLTAADLIKNLVFQRLAAEGADTHEAYHALWPFDASFWETQVAAGRYSLSRSSLFLNQWLVSRVGEEVSTRATFARFKHYVEYEAGTDMRDLLTVIRDQARGYQYRFLRAQDAHADLTPIELCVYRSRALDSEVLQPLLIWLTEPERGYQPESIDRVVAAVESWLVRRSLLRVTTASQGQVVANLIRTCRTVDDQDVAEAVERFLRRQNVVGGYWPGDEEIRVFLSAESMYTRFRRSRVRMYLEAAEDARRGFVGSGLPMAGGRVARTGYPIEHVMPQRWQTHWPVNGLAAEIDRENHVHRLGNLTLLTTALNSAVSNGPWLGAGGKREKLDAHDVFLLNRQIRDQGHDGWDESRIDARTTSLVEALLAIWPVPAGHMGALATGPVTPATPWVMVRDLVAADLIVPGTRLIPRPGPWQQERAEVQPDGTLLIGAKAFDTPSAAGHHLRHAATNGWTFWQLPDGRKLSDLRSDFLATLTRQIMAPGEGKEDVPSPAPGTDTLPQTERCLNHSDLQHLADLVTAQLNPTGARLSPSGSDPDFTWRRYVSGPDGSTLAIGARRNADHAGDSPPPLWLRVHRDTENFAAVQTRIRRSSPALVQHDAAGNVWLPLPTSAKGPLSDVAALIADHVTELLGEP